MQVVFVSLGWFAPLAVAGEKGSIVRPDATAIAHAELCKGMHLELRAEGEALGKEVGPGSVSCEVGAKAFKHAARQVAFVDECYRELGWSKEEAAERTAEFKANARGAVLGCAP